MAMEVSLPLPLLPGDVIKEILVRMSVKELLRLRSVCKEWCILIDSPEFIRTHRKVSKLGLFINDFEHLYWLDLDTLDSSSSSVSCTLERLDKSRGFVALNLGCCNGLIVEGYCGYLCSGGGVPFLWNPSTRNYGKVSFNKDYASYSLTTVIGLGYDPLIDDHKIFTSTVIVPQKRKKRSVCVFQQYCVKAKTWKKLICNDALSENYGYDFGHVFMENSTLYWVVTPWDEEEKEDNEDAFCNVRFILGYDIVTEKHTKLPLPTSFEETHCFVFGPCDLDGCLSVVRQKKNERSCFEIWVMKEYGKEEERRSWTKLFSVVAAAADHGPGYFQSRMRPIKYYESTNQLLLYVDCERLILYDSKMNTFKHVHVPILGVAGRFEAYLAVQTLVGI
ncbi:putative F-box protein At3g16210 [Humulus lupulus]|uniref:putative F-box protein At3g16210 n=1 Tax=Humulus lupulus TaxID=3486 RepID=UPI002B407F5D|nr:putative F-box protein At3g16210 [Humulus lupulus]